MSFGDVLRADFDTPEAVAAEIDRQVIGNYKLFPSNYLAAKVLGDEVPLQNELSSQAFDQRLAQCAEQYRSYWLAMYANPVRSFCESSFCKKG